MKNLTCKQQADVSVQLVLQLMRNLTYEISKEQLHGLRILKKVA